MKERDISRIQSFISSNDNRPLIIDVSSAEERDNFHLQFFQLQMKSVFELTQKNSELPSIASIYDFMESCTEKCLVLCDLSTLLKLNGEQEMFRVLHSLLLKSYSSKFIILTFQCSQFLNEKDPRNKEKILKVGEGGSCPSSLVFMKKGFESYAKCENGLCSALRKYEMAISKIYVTTEYRQKDFPNSLLKIETCDSSYDLLCIKDAAAKKLNRAYGSLTDWETLLSKLEGDSIEDTIKEFINTRDFIKNIEDWSDKSDFDKWLIFIYSKLKNVKTGNYAVDYSLNKSNKSSDILNYIYDSIIDLSYKEDGYWDKYEQRKSILRKINDDEKLYEYCNFIRSKGANAIYYLTDNTDNEKKLIIELIDQHYLEFSKRKLLDVLSRVYRDLYDYLSDYNLGNEFLNNYFDEYKYLKVTNHLTDEFKSIVDVEARERNYKKLLMYRSEKLEELSYNNSVVYFIDALGVEFLSFIIKKCNDLRLAVNVHVCHANLPTLTAKNTEFREFFAKKGVKIKDEKELDELIHDGKNDYDFDRYKLPIHIIEEFKIIEKNLKDIRKNLKEHKFEKAVILSDHGATRLAILNTESVKIEVESVGEHGGRVCKAIDNMEIIPNAISEEGYWILGDYNSFKGGRKGKVEMHGGATLEEVVVPVIEVSDKSNNEIKLKVITTVIKVGYKKPAILQFYLTKKIKGILVKVNGNQYQTTTTDDQTFESELTDIKKSGTYSFELWSNGQLVSNEGAFKIEKIMATTNDLF